MGRSVDAQSQAADHLDASLRQTEGQPLCGLTAQLRAASGPYDGRRKPVFCRKGSPDEQPRRTVPEGKEPSGVSLLPPGNKPEPSFFQGCKVLPELLFPQPGFQKPGKSSMA